MTREGSDISAALTRAVLAGAEDIMDAHDVSRFAVAVSFLSAAQTLLRQTCEPALAAEILNTAARMFDAPATPIVDNKRLYDA